MRIAILGATGQLGRTLLGVARNEGHESVALTRDVADVADADAVGAALRDASPDAVVNCAAFTDVDGAERRPGEAFRTNAVGALHVARAAAAIAARCVYVSTDYVFGGERREEAYAETDAPDPLNVYGVSKLAGEILTRQGVGGREQEDAGAADPAADAPRPPGAGHAVMVARVSALFGFPAPSRREAGPWNFLEAILQRAEAGHPLKVVRDVSISPTYAADAARGIVAALEEGVAGTVHLANRGRTTWLDLARFALSCAGHAVEVTPVDVAGWPQEARRPRNSALVTRRAEELGYRMPRWEEGVRAYVERR